MSKANSKGRARPLGGKAPPKGTPRPVVTKSKDKAFSAMRQGGSKRK